MDARRSFDCAQVLVLPGSAAELDAEWAMRLIRSKQFWHVVLSGTQADVCAKRLREFPGMPNFIVETEGNAQAVQNKLALRGIIPKTLAVTEEKCSEYAQVFPEAKLFVVSEGD